jgi:hypothetical protein
MAQGNFKSKARPAPPPKKQQPLKKGGECYGADLCQDLIILQARVIPPVKARTQADAARKTTSSAATTQIESLMGQRAQKQGTIFS